MADIYEDERLAKLQEQQAVELQEVKDTLGGIAKEAASNFDQQKQEIQNFKDTQTQLQQEQSDLTIAQIEQNKAKAEQSYKKEQSAAYVDYQKQTAQHGVQAEQMAAMGMSGTGYSETNRMAAYNAYQARVAAARESYDQIVTDYNNAIDQAKQQNSSALAQIAYDTLIKGLEINNQRLQYSQNLALQELSMTQSLRGTYYNREQSLLSEIKNERVQAASVMAQTGDFSGYKDALGLTDEQIRKLETQYRQQIQSQKDAENYQKMVQQAEIMAAAGDFSGYQKLYGLTDEQVANLQAAAVKGAEPEPLSTEDIDYWRNRFAMAKDNKDLQDIAEEMRKNGINEDLVYTIYSQYEKQEASMPQGLSDIQKEAYRRKLEGLGIG